MGMETSKVFSTSMAVLVLSEARGCLQFLGLVWYSYSV